MARLFFSDQQSEESDESELETDEDTELKPKEIIPVKRKREQSRKRLKIPKFVKPLKQAQSGSSVSQKLVKPEDVFEPLQRGENKSLKIALKVDSDLEKRLDSAAGLGPSTSAATDTHQEKGGFGLIYPVKKPEDSDTKSTETTSDQTPEFITSEQLAANRISINGLY